MLNGSKIFFEKYGIPKMPPSLIDDMDLTFSNVLDKFESLITKNKDEFIANIKAQQAKAHALGLA